MLIDGVADLVHDVNEPGECCDLVGWLHNLAIQLNCPIICVIHLNPGQGAKTRGHLGSQLERKAETNLRLEKNGETTVAWSEMNRRASIPKTEGARFRWSEGDQMHMSLAFIQDSNAAESRRGLAKFAEGLFKDAGKEELSWTELVSQIAAKAGITKSGARKRLETMKEAGVISKRENGSWRLSV